MGLLSERSEDDEEHGEITLSGLEDIDVGRPDELVYDLDDWSDGDRAVLRDRLEVLAMPHRWEGASLVVAAADEAWIERVMDQVDDQLSMSLDEDAEQVAYDLTGWDDQNRALLVDGLTDEAIPHRFDGDDLLVHEIDEQRVDELVEAILRPDDEPAPVSANGGIVMGDLFVGADRLARDARDHDAARTLEAAIAAGEGAPPPYGMDRLWWDGVLAQAGELVTLLHGYAIDDDAVADRARTLREGLRPYV